MLEQKFSLNSFQLLNFSMGFLLSLITDKFGHDFKVSRFSKLLISNH